MSYKKTLITKCVSGIEGSRDDYFSTRIGLIRRLIENDFKGTYYNGETAPEDVMSNYSTHNSGNIVDGSNIVKFDHRVILNGDTVTDKLDIIGDHKLVERVYKALEEYYPKIKF